MRRHLIFFAAEDDTNPKRERGWALNGTYFSWNSLSGTALAAGEMREFVLPLPAASAVPLSKVSAIEHPPSLTRRVIGFPHIRPLFLATVPHHASKTLCNCSTNLRRGTSFGNANSSPSKMPFACSHASNSGAGRRPNSRRIAAAS